MYLAVLWICDSVLDAELGNDISVEFHKKFFFRKKKEKEKTVKLSRYKNSEMTPKK